MLTQFYSILYACNSLVHVLNSFVKDYSYAFINQINSVSVPRRLPKRRVINPTTSHALSPTNRGGREDSSLTQSQPSSVTIEMSMVEGVFSKVVHLG